LVHAENRYKIYPPNSCRKAKVFPRAKWNMPVTQAIRVKKKARYAYLGF